MTRTKSPQINYVLWWFILVAVALLVTVLTLPLLNHSVAIFGVVAGACWLAVFAGAVLLTKMLNRAGDAQPADDEAGAPAPVETSSD